MCVTAIANMQQAAMKEGKPKTIFSKDKEIIPFIEQYWEALTTMPRRVTQSWYSTVQRALVKDIGALFTFEETLENGQTFGLVSTNLTHIKPNYDAMIKGGSLKITDEGITQGTVQFCYCNTTCDNTKYKLRGFVLMCAKCFGITYIFCFCSNKFSNYRLNNVVIVICYYGFCVT